MTEAQAQRTRQLIRSSWLLLRFQLVVAGLNLLTGTATLFLNEFPRAGIGLVNYALAGFLVWSAGTERDRIERLRHLLETDPPR